MKSQKEQLSKVFLMIALGWSLFIAFIIAFLAYQKYQQTISLALLEAKTSTNKDLAYRKWVATHGGVYVPITSDTPPNPYLKVANRDLNTTSGIQMTLINPAYALRQMTEQYSALYGIRSHLTSDKYINPANAPDIWEKKAFNTLLKTRQPTYEMRTINGQQNLSYMIPFFIKSECMKCHAQQGYQLGDVRGALTITLPMSRYDDVFKEGLFSTISILGLVWILGMYWIRWGYRLSHSRIQEKINLYEQNLFSLVSLIEQRDNYTAGHGQRVGEYSRLIAAQMGLSPTQQEELYRAGALHDIGKVAIPDSILLKPGALEPIERVLIEEHVNAGYNLLKRVDIFASIAEIVRYHHERLDGSGYPNKLSGDAIPLTSQIMAIADCFDAMTTNRIYKARKSLNEALAELASTRGIKFRSDIIDAALIALANVSLEANHSQRPTTLLEMERFSYFYKDSLTGVYTSAYLNFLFFEPDFDQYRQLWLVNLGNIGQFNKAYGWDKGDGLLKHYAQTLQEYYPQLPIIRFQGDDFIIFRKDDKVPQIEDLYAHWLKEVGITVTVSIIALDSETVSNLENLQSRLAKR
jgi:HD-GYP domain-containing protein (c-di-GMP phosphodiesterase class II)